MGIMLTKESIVIMFVFLGSVLVGMAFVIYLFFKDKDMRLVVLWAVLCIAGIFGLLGITIIIFSLIESLVGVRFSSKEIFDIFFYTVVKLMLAVVTIGTAYIAYRATMLASKESKLQALHSESGWRATLLEVLDHVDWGPNDLEKIRNRINVKWSSNVNFDTENMNDEYIKKIIREELNLLSHKEKITYKDSFKLRQLVRMLLDNDFQVQNGNEIEYSDADSVDKYLVVSSKDNEKEKCDMENIQKMIDKANSSKC